MNRQEDNRDRRRHAFRSTSGAVQTGSVAAAGRRRIAMKSISRETLERVKPTKRAIINSAGIIALFLLAVLCLELARQSCGMVRPKVPMLLETAAVSEQSEPRHLPIAD